MMQLMRGLFYLAFRLSVIAAVIAACFMACAYCAIPGVPETRPDTIARYTVSWSNDWFALPMSLSHDQENDPRDDWRTNSLAGSARFGRWVYALDDSMLTSKSLGLRTDEITATAGYDLGHVIAGAGVRSRRDYGGQALQNAWHKVWHDAPIDLDQDAHGEQAVVYVLGDPPRVQLDKYFHVQPIASALIASNGESAVDAGALIVLRGRAYSIFAGARYQLRDGARSELLRTIQAHERGLAAQYGFAKHDGWGFDVTVTPRSYAGAMTWRF